MLGRATDSRNEAMNRLDQQAISLGANAVFGRMFDSGELIAVFDPREHAKPDRAAALK